ncbi:AraC family transcriptional regulator [Croceicoccus sediminis]|uniref:AraC family transcriptional regulator n=1 Tax=Croceicoccus sediminis TaxID=2571150 RepID=UPI0011845C55|nr:AraC family transcriptional regulator [Croceicoccus sediminis]
MKRPQIAAQFLRHILDCVELTGRSAEPLLQRFGIARSVLEDREATIDLRDFLALFEAAAEFLDNPAFGLQAGRLTGSDSLGALSFLFLAAPSLGRAFEAMAAHLLAMQQGSRCEFEIEGDCAAWTYSVTAPNIGRRRQDAEYSLSATHALARNYCNGDFELREVWFEHEMISPYARYRDLFGCDVFFEQPVNAIRFDARLTDRRGNLLSAELFPIIEDHLRRREPASDVARGDVVAAVRGWLAVRDVSGPLLLNDAVRDLGISRAALQRGLEKHDTSWREIKGEHRITVAKRLLGQSRRSIADIALATGYSESASFTRAFLARTGKTPMQFRKGQQS